MPKKNPIKKRVQGSQKPNPMPVGDPKKYMGDNEWEQYNEPQGINSPAAKRVMKTESVEMVSSPIYGTRAPVHINPSPQVAQRVLGASEFQDLSGIADEHNVYIWGDEEVKHNDVVDQLGLSPYKVVPFVYIHARASDPHKSVVVSSWNMAHRNADLVDRVFKTNPNYRKVFGNAPVDTGELEDKKAKYVGQRSGPKFGISEKIDEELGPLGGFMAPLRGGDSKFAIPDNAAILDPQAFEFSALEKSKKDAKKVRKTVNKNIKKQQSNPNFEDELSEMIRLPIFSLISGQYEVKDDEKTVGYAHVKDGVIAELTCASGANEEYRGQILTHLLNTIVDEADMQNSNLSLQLQNKDADDMKRFLERFGFKHVGHGVMQRTAGSVRPPAVHYSNGQEGP